MPGSRPSGRPGRCPHRGLTPVLEACYTSLTEFAEHVQAMLGPDVSIFKACSGSTRRPRSDGHLGNRRRLRLADPRMAEAGGAAPYSAWSAHDDARRLTWRCA